MAWESLTIQPVGESPEYGPNGPTVNITNILRPPTDDAEPVRPARSTLGAVLLNTSGLGLGFGYLGRWVPAALTLVISVLWVVVVGYNADASGWVLVWLGQWLVGVVATTLVAARMAARHPEPTSPRGRVLPAAVGGALVVALVAGYVLYGVAGANAYTDATAAQARADCPAAIDGFDAVTGPFRLAPTADVAGARDNRAQCRAYLAASEAEQRGDFPDAVARYQDYRRDHPDTVLVPFAQDGVERTHTAWAGSLRAAGNPQRAIEVYRDLLPEVADDRARTTEVRAELGDTYLERIAQLTALAGGTAVGTERATLARQAVDAMYVVLRELGDTPANAAIPQAFTDTYYAADGLFPQGRFCEALPVLQYYSGLAPDGLTSGAVNLANAERATAMFECGLGLYNGSDFGRATTQLTQFVEAFPAEPRVAQARSVLIAAHILAINGAPPFVPAPLGDNNPGPISVTFYNDSQVEQRVYVAGPTAHEFVLPGCPGCPSSYSSFLLPLGGGGGPCDDLSGRPSLTLRLVPGTYLSISESSIDSTDVDTSTIDPGFVYTNCVYIRDRF